MHPLTLLALREPQGFRASGLQGFRASRNQGLRNSLNPGRPEALEGPAIEAKTTAAQPRYTVIDISTWAPLGKPATATVSRAG